MSMTYHSRYYEFPEKDAAYEIGRLMGACIRETVADVPDELSPQMQKALARSHEAFPQYVREIEDRARGAGIPFNKMFYYIAGYDLFTRVPSAPKEAPDVEHCSDVMIRRADGTVLMGHNEDNAHTAEDSFIVKHITDDGWYAELAIPEALAGATAMWNSKGIALGCNAIIGDRLAEDNLPTLLLARSFADCGSIAEIIEQVKAHPIVGDLCFNILDRKTGEYCSLEVRQGEYSVVYPETKYAHTNHFLHLPGAEEYNAPIFRVTHNSEFRQEKATELLEPVDPETANYNDLVRILEYRGADNMSSIRKVPIPGSTKSYTNYMVLLDSMSGMVHITDYMSHEQVSLLW